MALPSFASTDCSPESYSRITSIPLCPSGSARCIIRPAAGSPMMLGWRPLGAPGGDANKPYRLIGGEIVKGVILAGGVGSRLTPLTEITNKHLLPVGKEPMLWHPVRQLVGSGIDEILIV